MRGTFGSVDLSTSSPPLVGKFIVFEGGEGSGKSEMMGRLKRKLTNKVVFTRNPGGTPIGEKIRGLVLSEELTNIDTGAELLLFLAARAQLVAEIIKPNLESGKTVICDRYELSTLAYELYGRQRPEHFALIAAASGVINQGCTPDATIFLDVSPEVGLKRAHSRPEEANRFDNEAVAFHERVREGYKKHINDYGRVFTINADRSLEEVWKDVERAVQSVL